MLFIRFASQLAFVRCGNKSDVEEFFLKGLKGCFKSYREAVSRGDECSTIVFLCGRDELGDDINGERVILLDKDIKYVIRDLLNWEKRNAIDSFELSPSILLMRYLKEWKDVYNELQNRYNAQSIDISSAVKLDGERNTILMLTGKPLSMSVGPLEVIEPPIVVEQPPSKIFKELREDILLYLTKTAGDDKWYELNIAIYSKEGDYKRHYERVIHILNELGVGLPLSEGWTLDHPFVMVTVAVYQVTFLSLLSPIEVKKILLGLEYDSSGNRVVDIDLYHKKKKVSWTEKEIKAFGKDRREIGMYFRKELIEKLPDADIKRFIY